MPKQSVLLAHAEVRDDVALAVKAPERVDVTSGEELRFRFSFRVLDEAAFEERWQFRLTIRVDDGREFVENAMHQDTAGRIDDFTSNLHVDLPFTAGEHEVHYSLEAIRYAQSRRDGATMEHQQSADGVILVRALG